MKPADLVSSMQRSVQQLEAFNEIAKALTSTLEVGEVLRLVMQKVSQLLKPSNWSLILQDEQTGELYFEIAVGENAAKLSRLRFRPGEGVAGEVFISGVAKRVDDVAADPSFSPRFDRLSEFRTRSLLAVPLVFRGSVLGVMELVSGEGGGPFSEEDLEASAAIADYAAIAISNARVFSTLQELTLTDEHTGLFNARHLDAQLGREVARAGRFIHRLSLVFVDLDDFKRVNDSHGHLAGSALLKEVGEIIRDCVRQVDLAFRYGGDEFATMLIETDVAGALTTAERICSRIRSHEFLRSRGLCVKLTASVGVATYPDHADSALELIQAADRAMYRVKAAGRDGVQTARILEETLRAPEDGEPLSGGAKPAPTTGWD
jgi:diguanylate cyclase (GGDEF)-like protein